MLAASLSLIGVGVILQLIESRVRESVSQAAFNFSSLTVPLLLIFFCFSALFLTQWLGMFFSLLIFLISALLLLKENRIHIYFIVGVVWYLLAFPLFSTLLQVSLPEGVL